jgi:hypothetical protein
MNKKRWIIFSILILIIVLVVLFFLQKKSDVTEQNGGKTNPFGKFFPTEQLPFVENQDNSGNEVITGNDLLNKKTRKISALPTAGFVIFNKEIEVKKEEQISTTTPPTPSTTKEIISVYRFMNRGDGHILETTSRDTNYKTISNITIPQIYTASFSPQGDSVVFGLEEGGRAVYYLGIIKKATSTEDYSFEKKSLGENILDFSFSPDNKRIALFSSSESSVTGGALIITDINNTSRKTILTLPTNEWLISWPSINEIIITNKAYSKELGNSYSVNPETGQIKDVQTNIFGLTVLGSPLGNNYFFSDNLENSYRANFYSKKTRGISYSTINSLPEKCVWSLTDENKIFCAVPEEKLYNSFPEAWYMGVFSSSDKIATFRTDKIGQYSEILEINPEGESIDAEKLLLSPDEKYLGFINKKDLSFWVTKTSF